MKHLDRRGFLKESFLVSASLAAARSAASAATRPEPDSGAKDKEAPLRIAVIGVRGRGRDHVAGFAGKNNCVVTTICDVDDAVIGPALSTAAKAQGGKAPVHVKDLRRVFDDKNIDAVSIAAPNHWHALAAIWAMQAGKDVYVEKPVSHNVIEGQRIVEAARKYKRICQSGTQSRSSTGIAEAIDYVHEQLGIIELAHGICFKLRPSIGKTDGDQEPPKTMDYDLWCGPAPLKMPHRKSIYGTVHYDWHWFWDYGNGDIGNQGIHQMDIARLGLNQIDFPIRVNSAGGRLGYQDDGETPNCQLSMFTYEEMQAGNTILFEVRGLPSRKSPFPASEAKGIMGPQFIGNVFYGEDGIVVCPNGGTPFALDRGGRIVKEFKGGGDHFGNFAKAVRSRRREDLNAEIEEGHLSSALCHMANISYRIGREANIGQDIRGIGFGEEGMAYDRLFDWTNHMRDEHKLSGKYTVGEVLHYDSKTGKFGRNDADALLTREYRKGFEVPDKV